MITLRMDSAKFAKYHRRLANEFVPALLRGVRSGAARSIAHLMRETRRAPPANPSGIGRGGAVNTGDFLRRWRWIALRDGARILNDHPAATVIEDGRRPGSKAPPLAAIRAWVIRRLKKKPLKGQGKRARSRAAEIRSLTYLISRAIGRRGLIGRKIVFNSQGVILRNVNQEILRELRRTQERMP